MNLQLIPAKKGQVARGRNARLEKARDSLIESAGKISANMLGMVSKVGGQIYALLFLSREPMSLDAIAESLKISKGSSSVNVRLLEDVGLVKKVWVKGDRKDYYEVSRDYPRKLLKGFFDRVREGIDNSLRVINRCHSEFQDMEDTLKGTEQEDARFMMSQLQLLSSFYGAASHLFDDFYQGRNVDSELLRRVILE